MKKFLGLFALSLTLCACKPYSEADLDAFDKKMKTFQDKKGLTLEHSTSGLRYKIIDNGGDKAIRSNDLIKVSYVGELLDGTEFDRQNTPIELPVNSLIAAWREVLAEMHVGDSCVLIAPPNIGYGAQEKGEIPKHSILYFRLKVHDSY